MNVGWSPTSTGTVTVQGPELEWNAGSWIQVGVYGTGAFTIEQGGRGVFTTYLLQGMSGEADRNGDGVVTASEIGWFVSDQVRLATKSRQTPIYGRMSGAGEVAFGMGSP